MAEGLPQSDWALAEVALVGNGELPQPKSAPLADFREGLVMDMPVCGVAIAGSAVLQAFEPHKFDELPAKEVFVGGAEDCMTAL